MRFKIFAVVLFSIVLVAFAGCSNVEIPDANEVFSIGSGQQTFRFMVVDADNNATAWDVSTNESIVGAALLDVDLIAGDVSAWGLFVTTVNGITADFDADGSWWALYVNGEMAMQGIDDIIIDTESEYVFVFTVG
ncbi:MAG: DUF4430 domain-containing protein [Defluviitaleaceae bacterium]|nr:DUF4430 domain-containing protein [Defluviitaleaceae bacterium]